MPDGIVAHRIGPRLGVERQRGAAAMRPVDTSGRAVHRAAMAWRRVAKHVLIGPSLSLALCGAARCEPATDFAFDQRPGAAIPAEAMFKATDGSLVRLGSLFGERPLILALGYFHCPSLCGVVRDSLLEALSRTGLRAGVDYDLLAVSIDPAETPADAAEAEADDRDRYAPGQSVRGWHFLTGEATPIEALERTVGFKSRYDIHLRQFLHPAGLVVLTRQGTVSSYLLGTGYHAGDIGAAVTLASSGGIARAALPLLLLCFHYDSDTGRYSLAIMKVLRLAGLLTIASIGGTLLLALRRERHDA